MDQDKVAYVKNCVMSKILTDDPGKRWAWFLLILNKAAHDWVQSADVQGNEIITCTWANVGETRCKTSSAKSYLRRIIKWTLKRRAIRKAKLIRAADYRYRSWNWKMAFTIALKATSRGSIHSGTTRMMHIFISIAMIIPLLVQKYPWRWLNMLMWRDWQLIKSKVLDV